MEEDVGHILDVKEKMYIVGQKNDWGEVLIPIEVIIFIQNIIQRVLKENEIIYKDLENL